MENNSTKILFLSVGDILYDNGYKTRLFGEMKLVSQFDGFEKYFVSFEKKQSYDLREREIPVVKSQLAKLGYKSRIVCRENRFKLDSLFDAWKFRKILEELHFDEGIIHAQSIYATYMAQLATRSNNKIRVIFDMHGLVGPELKQQKISAPMQWITNRVERKCIENSDHIVTASETLKEYLVKEYESENVTSLPCLSDPEIFSKVSFANIEKKRKELGLPTDKKIAVYLGGMQTWQNFYQIKTFVKRNDLFLLMITNNTMVAQATFADIKDKKIVSLPHNRVWEYLHLADMGILYREENELNRIAFPTKVAEYLLCGLPVVHNGTVEDIKKIIDQNALGLNVEEMGEDAEGLDTGLSMKKKCRAYALKNLVWDVKKEELLNLYKDLAKKKIIYMVTSGFYGGAQRYNLDLAKEFSKNNYMTEVVFGSEGNTKKFEEELAENKISYTKLNNLQRSMNPIKNWLGFWEIYTYLKKSKPDVLHLSSSIAGVLGRFAGSLLDIEKVIYTAHGWSFNEEVWWGKKDIYLLWEWFFQGFCDEIVCVSQYDYDLAIERGFDPEKLRVIHNGIQIPNIKFQIPDETSSKLTTKNSKPQLKTNEPNHKKKTEKNSITIGTVANFFKTKNLSLFVEIAEGLVKSNKDVYRFVIVGDGPERENIENLIAEKNLKKYFELTGHVNDIHKHMRDFDVFLLTSSKEGFPYILLEAGLMKIPVVASQVGGVGELIENEKTGYVVKGLNKDEFVDKIGESVNNKNTQKMSENLYQKIVGEFGLDKMVEEHKKLYSY